MATSANMAQKTEVQTLPASFVPRTLYENCAPKEKMKCDLD